MKITFAIASILFFSNLAGAAAKDENRLQPEKAEASSYAETNWNKYDENYHPNFAFDDNPNTAWVEGVPGHGEGERLIWRVAPLAKAESVRIKIRNGYQKSKKLFAANSAPKEITLFVYGMNHSLQAEKKLVLKRTMGWQEIEIPLDESKGLTSFEVKIGSVYPGSVYKDTCISDIQVFVRSKVPYDAKAEVARFAKLKDWIGEREQTAKYFAKLPGTYPFQSFEFKKVESHIYECDYNLGDDQLQTEGKKATPCYPPEHSSYWLEKGTHIPEFLPKDTIAKILNFESRIKKLVLRPEWWNVTFNAEAKQRKLPDFKDPWNTQGVRMSGPWMRASDLSYFEAKDAVRKIDKELLLGDDEPRSIDVYSNAKIEFFDESAARKVPRLIYLWTKGAGHDRGSFAYIHFAAYEYDNQGHLDSVTSWTPRRGIGGFGPKDFLSQLKDTESFVEVGPQINVTQFTYDDHGRVSNVSIIDFAQGSEYDESSTITFKKFGADGVGKD